MSNVLDDTKQQQILALGRLGWSLRRIEQAVAVSRSDGPDGQMVLRPEALCRVCSGDMYESVPAAAPRSGSTVCVVAVSTIDADRRYHQRNSKERHRSDRRNPRQGVAGGAVERRQLRGRR